MWLMIRMTSKYESGPEDDELRAIQRSFYGKNVTCGTSPTSHEVRERQNYGRGGILKGYKLNLPKR